MKTVVKIKQTEYPEEYEINELTIQDHFYLQFGFPDDRRLYKRFNGESLSKYNKPEVDTKLIFR